MADLSRSSILIVDDSAANLVALRAILSTLEVDVIAAETPEAALSLLTEHAFSLAILDVQMAPMSGFELAKVIRSVKKFQLLPIIFMTASSPDEDISLDGHDAGAVDVLFKPVNPKIVRSKAKTFIELDRQRRTLEAQIADLERLRAEADRANRAKAMFLANMSHEMRTPLGNIMGYAEMLTNYCKIGEKETRFANTILKNSRDLLKIIDDVLDLSTIEAGKLRVERVAFDVRGLATDVHTAMEVQAKNKGISFELSVAAGVPTSVITDPTKLKQVINNMVSNAIKFTEEGGVKLGLDYEGEHLIIRVTDSGIGIDEVQQRRLFKAFSQADVSTSRKFGGTGLGLALSRNLCQALGGDLVLLGSRPGEGSVFEARLAAEKVVVVEAGPENLDVYAARLRERSLVGLYIDDIEDNRELAQLLLEQMGVALELAEGGPPGLSMAASKEYDFVLLDIQMPGMDGFEVLRELRKQGYERPVFALSAHAMNHQVNLCLQRGFNAFISKPLSRNKFIGTLRDHHLV